MFFVLIILKVWKFRNNILYMKCTNMWKRLLLAAVAATHGGQIKCGPPVHVQMYNETCSATVQCSTCIYVFAISYNVVYEFRILLHQYR